MRDSPAHTRRTTGPPAGKSMGASQMPDKSGMAASDGGAVTVCASRVGTANTTTIRRVVAMIPFRIFNFSILRPQQ